METHLTEVKGKQKSHFTGEILQGDIPDWFKEVFGKMKAPDINPIETPAVEVADKDAPHLV